LVGAGPAEVQARSSTDWLFSIVGRESSRGKGFSRCRRALPGRVPEQARRALQHALEAAKRGHEQAAAALERAAEGAARDRKPENTGRPGGTPGGPPDGAPGVPGGGKGRP